jgi:flagella basal body P-ring formation protein FlgA
MKRFLAPLLIAAAGMAQAEAVVALKTIRANTVLTAHDVSIDPQLPSYGVDKIDDAVGMETRVVLYAGRPIRPENLQAPALVERNQIVPLIFNRGGLEISTQGRALDRGAEGEIIRVMNISSRTTLFGTVRADGSIDVTGR